LALSNIKIIKGIGGGCDEETMRVIKLSPLWKPGSVNGVRVPVNFIIPVAFALTN
jgi:Gram-negative bacterial TonB protein C-terminal